MPLNILIVGAGVCGPALATLLQYANPQHKITVVERASSLRVAGQQLDVKAQGLPILKKMGLHDNIKPLLVAETGMQFVDAKGKSLAEFGVTGNGKRNYSLSTDREIMRSDLVNMLYEESLKRRKEINDSTRPNEIGGSLKYEFDKSITELSQDDDGVDVKFSSGDTGRYDLVVGADGQGSRTRRLAWGAEASAAAFHSLGLHTAYFSIPRAEGEGGMAKWFNAPESRSILIRNGDRPMTQVYLFARKNAELFRQAYKEPLAKQKQAFRQVFSGAGWEADRFLEAMESCDDFYAHEVGQIKIDPLYKGRVVLVGDAGYCPAPFTGMGTTLSLIGAYVLAGEMARHKNNIGSALKAYSEVVRPPVDEYQRLPPATISAMFPSSKFGVWLLQNTAWALATLKIDQLIHKVLPAENSDGRWPIPDYPELNLPVS
ncbi:cytochrome P450 [Apiospora arundinis]